MDGNEPYPLMLPKNAKQVADNINLNRDALYNDFIEGIPAERQIRRSEFDAAVDGIIRYLDEFEPVELNFNSELANKTYKGTIDVIEDGTAYAHKAFKNVLRYKTNLTGEFAGTGSLMERLASHVKGSFTSRRLPGHLNNLLGNFVSLMTDRGGNIYGIGKARSEEVLKTAGIGIDVRAKNLTEDELSRIASILDRNYVVEGQLRRQLKDNINRLKAISSYRGIRHRLGLPVNGQRTRTNARTRKGPKRTVAGKKSIKDRR